MAEDLEKLEREIDAELARLGHELDEPIPGALRQRVNANVRTALNEIWLAERIEVTPRKSALARVRSGIRSEIRKQLRLHRVWRVASVGTAAAVVLLCVGLVQHATMLRRAANSAEMVDLFVAAGDQVIQEDSASGVRDDLAAIEEGVTHLAGDRDQVQDRLDGVSEDVEDLLSGPEDADLTL